MQYEMNKSVNSLLYIPENDKQKQLRIMTESNWHYEHNISILYKIFYEYDLNMGSISMLIFKLYQ